jgi:hypothetical protein
MSGWRFTAEEGIPFSEAETFSFCAFFGQRYKYHQKYFLAWLKKIATWQFLS